MWGVGARGAAGRRTTGRGTKSGSLPGLARHTSGMQSGSNYFRDFHFGSRFGSRLRFAPPRARGREQSRERPRLPRLSSSASLPAVLAIRPAGAPPLALRGVGATATTYVPPDCDRLEDVLRDILELATLQDTRLGVTRALHERATWDIGRNLFWREASPESTAPIDRGTTILARNTHRAMTVLKLYVGSDDDMAVAKVKTLPDREGKTRRARKVGQSER